MNLIYTLPILCGIVTFILTKPIEKHRFSKLIMVLIPVTSMAIYGLIGTPKLADHPFDQSQKSKDLWSLISRLEHLLATSPEDLDGWILMARAYRSLNLYDKAASAFSHAAALDPNNPLIPLSLAESLVLQANGQVTPRAKISLDVCLKLDPNQHSARYYMGVYARQQGRPIKAQKLWLTLQKDLRPGTPLSALVQTQLNQLKTAKK